MRGAGDLVAKVTEATGIKKVVEAAFPNGGCGCAQRQQKLNEMFKRRLIRRSKTNKHSQVVALWRQK